MTVSRLIDPRPRLQQRATVLVVLLVVSLLAAQAASAQAAATLRGVVLDADSGEPVAGALISIEDRQALTSSDGSFRFVGLRSGNYRVRVDGFGYRPHDQTVRVSVDMDPIEVRLDPDPLQLDGLTVTANGRAAVRGVVLNARSLEPIEWAELVVTRGVTRQVGRREASSDQGVFSIANIPVGEYLLRVDRLGFESLYVPVSHTVPPPQLEIRLEPDSAVLNGLAEMNRALTARRNGHPGSVRVYDEEALRFSRVGGMRHFVEAFTSLILTECSDDSPWRSCILVRGTPTRPRLVIDEIEVFDPPPPSQPMRIRVLRDSLSLPPPPPPPYPPISLDVLSGYDPRDFYSFEVFECGGRVEMRAYTYQYIERMARQPHVLLPACGR